jgi:hypothetical protein
VNTVFLGLIAVSTVVMAVVQIGVIVYLARLSKRIDGLSTRIEREIGPLAERLSDIAGNLQHATGLAGVQVERIDRLFSGVARRADETMSLVHGAVAGPIRDGAAVLGALRGVIAAIRAIRGGKAGRSSARFDDEDPLFIG